MNWIINLGRVILNVLKVQISGEQKLLVLVGLFKYFPDPALLIKVSAFF